MSPLRIHRGTFILRALPALLLAASPAARAHHSTTAEFDVTKRVALTGTMTKVDWVNPHIFVYLDAKNPAGAVDSWRLETNPPAWFRRVGVTRADFSRGIGQSVTVETNRAKDGSTYGYMLKITFADGQSLALVNAAAAAAGKPEGDK
jgi:hypothetical protein